MQRVDIGRRTMWGNPYFPARGEERQGKTLPDYEVYLAARRRDKQWAIDLARSIGIPDVPVGSTFEQELILLGRRLDYDSRLWCPGCKEQSAQRGVCHGHALEAAALSAYRADSI